MNYMQRALDLAKKGQYSCAPNPMVGCVIVRDNKIVGEGYHHKAGEAHAEIIALEQAGGDACGSTVYVTLEPCCHHGRTGPCVDALLEAKVAEVVIACLDPNPKVSGRGIARLQDAGVKVTVGELEKPAQALNKIFFHYIKTGLPFVIAKWAMSLDGKTATHKLDSKWITSDPARQHAHQIRQTLDAILIGSGTLIADNPQLTVRLPEVVRQPLRVVLDARARSPIESRLFSNELPGNTLLVTTNETEDAWCQKFRDNNIEVLQLPATKGRIDLTLVLKALAEREITSVLVEGGAHVSSSFVEQGLVQQIYAYIAPKTIGGENAPGALAGIGIESMFDAQQWKFTGIKPLNPDVLLIAEKINV